MIVPEGHSVFAAQIFQRHDFVSLCAAWRAHDVTPLDEDDLRAIEAWRAAGRPFVIASRHHGDAPQTLRLGLAGPGKTRLGFGTGEGAVAPHIRPPLLAEIAGVLPPAWQGVLGALDSIASRYGVILRAYGSAAWQALTGLDYLTPTSDLDLLIEPLHGADLPRALAALAAVEGIPRLDGEIRFVGLGDVAWREWQGGADKVLLKTRQGPRLIARAEAA